MRTDVGLLEEAKADARKRRLVPGRFVVVRDTQELALVTRFNEADVSLYPGHEYPLVILTGFGEQECELSDVRACDHDHAQALMCDDSETRVHPKHGSMGWQLFDDGGRALYLDDLRELKLPA